VTAPSSIDGARFVHDQLESASPDLLRSMLTTFINALISAEADAVCGAPNGMPGPGRVNVRNGYRHRDSRHSDRCGVTLVRRAARLVVRSGPCLGGDQVRYVDA
jgi:transposase-like protein